MSWTATPGQVAGCCPCAVAPGSDPAYRQLPPPPPPPQQCTATATAKSLRMWYGRKAGGQAAGSQCNPYTASNPTPLALVVNCINRPVTGGEGKNVLPFHEERKSTQQAISVRACEESEMRPPSWRGQSTSTSISCPDGPPCRPKKGC